MTESDRPSLEQVAAFLTQHHEGAVEDLAPLDGGFWSTAYSYAVQDAEYVFRLAESGEGFLADQAAQQFGSDELPVPEVLEVGEGLGRWFAISRRAHGDFLENIDPDDHGRAGPMIDRLLASLRSAVTPANASVDWVGKDSSSSDTWRAWLERRLVDDPNSTVSGWRSAIAADPELDALYQRTEKRIFELLDHCPERRDLIHGDLLHQNVLIAHDASKVNAVFSWKCSELGDHLYDVAWLSFWERWHPGIERVDAWNRTIRSVIDGDDMQDAALRHHCYELHIGAQHLAWCAWTGNGTSLAGVALRTAHVLERGPRNITRPSVCS